ncbi:alpha/beta fold hydrolase [Castellaniella sp. GW247-6E4]|uniref:alpha/beta fold hydrolase n=1 Tax=Castellaniella sp. GW247-6E4 TaxID=3140380 RepID=UPI0033152110
MVQADNVITRIQQIGTAAASKEVIVHSFSSHTDSAIVEWAQREVIKTPRHVAEPAIRSLDSFDVRDKLSRLTVPTLIIVGEEDEITPIASSQFLHDAIPGSELHIIPKAAHFPMLERSHTFNQTALAFLDKIPY